MLTMLELAQEFGLSIRSFHHAVEAYKIRDRLAEEDVAASMWVDWWGFKMEAFDGIPQNIALVSDAGAPAILHTDSGLEIQILDTHGLEKPGHHDGGGIIRTTAPFTNAMKPAGEWNRYIITCNGNHLQVELNGEPIIDVKLDEGPMKDRPLEGYIGLQDHGRPVWYRNIRVKRLDD